MPHTLTCYQRFRTWFVNHMPKGSLAQRAAMTKKERYAAAEKRMGTQQKDRYESSQPSQRFTNNSSTTPRKT